MTDRLLRALDSPSLKIMGHPTGRILLQREAYSFDFEQVAAKLPGARCSSKSMPVPNGSTCPATWYVRQTKRLPIHHLDGRSPPSAPAEYALWRYHSPARLA